MNNYNFLIEENDLILAKEICRYIENPEIRNRAVANSTAALIAKKYFEECDIDIETGLHNVSCILENLEISDIYINNNYIDVRLYFNDNELCVPQSHFDKNILPAAYMFIKVNEDLSGGIVTGFIIPSSVDKNNVVNGYYPVSEDSLISYYDIESFLVNKDEPEITSESKTQIFDYLDGKLEDCNSFYRELIESRELRKRLIDAAKAKIVFNYISIQEPSSATLEINEIEALEDIESAESFELDLDLPSEQESLEEITDFSGLEELEPQDSIEDSIIEDVNSKELLPYGDENELTEIDELASIDYENAQENTDLIEDEDINSIEEDEKTSFEEPGLPEETEILQNAEVLPAVEEEENDVITDAIEEYEPLNTEATPIAKDEYTTAVTPSLESVEYNNESEGDNSIADLSEFVEEDLDTQEEMSSENEPAEESSENKDEDNTPQIDTLFTQESEDGTIEENFAQPKKKKSLILPIISIAAVVAGLGYFGYTKFQASSLPVEKAPENNTVTAINQETKESLPVQDAMPLETVENTPAPKIVNEGTSVAIPAIEQNLDASILVSNLSVKWEVPAAYSTSATAKRYFTKMGKIIQLNLKTELLLLNKPPITNKIALELEFNNASNKFQIKGITASSGEESVDEIIRKTVKNALDINLNMNMNSFKNIQGNPILIINL